MSSKVDILINERNNILNQINSVRGVNVQILGVGMVAISAIFSYTLVANKSYELLILIPYLFFGVFFYYILLISGVFALAGYKQYLEEQLNKEAEIDFIKWEVISKKHIRTNLVNSSIMLIFFLSFIGAVMLISVKHNTFSYHFQIALIISYCIWLFLFVLLVISFFKLYKLDERVYGDLKKNKL